MKPARIRYRVIAFGALVPTVAAVTLFATPARPALAATNLITLTATSATNSEVFKGVSITCPRGTYVLGGGGNVIGGGHSVRLYMSKPNVPPFTPNTWHVAAIEEGAYPYSWYIIGWTICGSGLTGHEIVVVEAGTNNGDTFGSVTVSCPSGKKVIGAGGSSHKGQAVLNSIYISPDLQSVTASAFLTEVAWDSGISLGVTAAAVCINPLPGQQVVTAPSASDSEDKVVHVACPSGTKVTSTGGGFNGAYGQAYIDALLPDGWGTGVFITVLEDDTGYPGNWLAYAQSICLP